MEKILIKAKTNKFLSFAQWIPLIFLIISCSAVMLAYSHIFVDIIDMKWQFETHTHNELCSETLEGDILFTEEDYKAKSDIYSSYHGFVVTEIADTEYTYKNCGDQFVNCTLLHYVSFENYCTDMIQWYLGDIIELCVVFAIISIALAVMFFILKLKLQYKIKVCEEKIYLKKGCKKSVITHEDITEIKTENNKLFIMTDDNKIKLSLSKKECCKLFDIFNLNIPDKITHQPQKNKTTQSNNDITNILD